MPRLITLSWKMHSCSFPHVVTCPLGLVSQVLPLPSRSRKERPFAPPRQSKGLGRGACDHVSLGIMELGEPTEALRCLLLFPKTRAKNIFKQATTRLKLNVESGRSGGKNTYRPWSSGRVWKGEGTSSRLGLALLGGPVGNEVIACL